jgi:hypothetical protein
MPFIFSVPILLIIYLVTKVTIMVTKDKAAEPKDRALEKGSATVATLALIGSTYT